MEKYTEGFIAGMEHAIKVCEEFQRAMHKFGLVTFEGHIIDTKKKIEEELDKCFLQAIKDGEYEIE